MLCPFERPERPGRPSFKVTWSQTKIMSPRAYFGCLSLFDPSEYFGDILCKLTNILTITANFLICIKLHQKDIGGHRWVKETENSEIGGLTDASCRTYLTQIVSINNNRLRISSLRDAYQTDSLHLMTEVLLCQRSREKY